MCLSLLGKITAEVPVQQGRAKPNIKVIIFSIGNYVTSYYNNVLDDYVNQYLYA